MKLTVGSVDKSSTILTLLVFRLPVFYNQQHPDHYTGNVTARTHPRHFVRQYDDAFAPIVQETYHSPEPKFHWIQYLL